VISGLGNLDDLIGDPINESMFVRDSPGPKSRKGVFQRFGLSDAVVGITPADILEEKVDLLQDFPVVLLPI